VPFSVAGARFAVMLQLQFVPEAAQLAMKLKPASAAARLPKLIARSLHVTVVPPIDRQLMGTVAVSEAEAVMDAV
jgi:hypothetical protein